MLIHATKKKEENFIWLKYLLPWVQSISRGGFSVKGVFICVCFFQALASINAKKETILKMGEKCFQHANETG